MTSEPEQDPRAEPVDPPPPGQVLEIRKYPNRRLYDATRSRHVTLDELYELVAAGHTVRVCDSRTGEDLTNQILLQALIERDPTKVNAVPTLMIHLMVRMNAQLIAGCFDLGLNQMFEAYRAASGGGMRGMPGMPGASGAAGAPGWPAGWPGVPGMNPSGMWGGPGASGPGAGAAWPNPFAPPVSAQGRGVPASPLEWLQAIMGAAPRAPSVQTGAEPAPSEPAPAQPDVASEPNPGGEPDDLDTLRRQVAALAIELERLKGSPEAREEKQDDA